MLTLYPGRYRKSGLWQRGSEQIDRFRHAASPPSAHVAGREGLRPLGGLRHTGSSKLGGLLALTALAAGGVIAYQYLFHRSGEAAIQLIPADARLVVTVDGTPSPGQALTFKRIADAIKREGLDTQWDKLMTSAAANTPLVRDLKPYTLGSLAFASLKPKNARTQTGFDGDTAIFLAIRNVDQVRGVLARDARKNTVTGLDYYQITNDTHCMAVIGSYLVIADKPEDLTKIDAVRRGQAPNIASQADYQQARAALPPDSNMMVFASESAVAQGMQQAGASTLALHSSVVHTHYLALGVAVHDQGFDIAMETPFDPPKGLASGDASHFASLSTAFWRKLPAGAYGVVAYSQPGKWYNYTRAMVDANADTHRMMEEGVASFERETSLNVTRDILPAAQGDVALAVYPDTLNPRKSVDGLLVLDDANGANPSALVDRVRALVERQSTRNGGTAWRFHSAAHNGATIWTLDGGAQQGLQHALNDGVREASRSIGMGDDTSASGQTHTTTTGHSGSADNSNKTITFAQVGNAVLVASSSPMLERALAAYTSGAHSLAEDSGYERLFSHLPSSSQNVTLVALPAIMEAFRPAITKLLDDSHSSNNVEDVLHLFGGQGTGLVAAQQYDGKILKMTMFLPLDYDKACHLAGAGQTRR